VFHSAIAHKWGVAHKWVKLPASHVKEVDQGTKFLMICWDATASWGSSSKIAPERWQPWGWFRFECGSGEDVLFTTADNDIWVVSDTLPEPSTMALAIGGMALLAGFKRRW